MLIFSCFFYEFFRIFNVLFYYTFYQNSNKHYVVIKNYNYRTCVNNIKMYSSFAKTSLRSCEILLTLVSIDFLVWCCISSYDTDSIQIKLPNIHFGYIDARQCKSLFRTLCKFAIKLTLGDKANRFKRVSLKAI